MRDAGLLFCKWGAQWSWTACSVQVDDQRLPDCDPWASKVSKIWKCHNTNKQCSYNILRRQKRQWKIQIDEKYTFKIHFGNSLWRLTLKIHIEILTIIQFGIHRDIILEIHSQSQTVMHSEIDSEFHANVRNEVPTRAHLNIEHWKHNCSTGILLLFLF